MIEGNTKRTIFYIIFFVLFLGLTIYGYILYTKGYGKYGEIRTKILPIVKKFNNSSYIKKTNGNIKAKYIKNRITFKYEDNNSKYILTAKYKKIANMDLIDLEYKVNESKAGEIIGRLLIDSVSILHSNKEGEIFKLINYEDLIRTNTLQGASLSKKGINTNLLININTNFLENIKDSNIFDENIKYITSDEITMSLNNKSLIDVLNDTNKYNYYKDTLIFIINSNNETYELICSDSSNNAYNLYESITSVVSLLDRNIYLDLLTSDFDYDNKDKLEKETYTLIKYRDINMDRLAMKLTIKKI